MTGGAIRDWFLDEARGYVRDTTSLVQQDDAMGDAAELLRLARALRGTAQLARESMLLHGATLLEGAAHALVGGSVTWSTDVRERIELTLVDLNVVLSGVEDGDSLRRRLDAAEDRWRTLDVRPWAPFTSAGAGGEEPGGLDDEAFLSFAAAEIDGIVTVLGESLDALAASPMDREAMKAVLRRQRALLGAARLDELPAVAETLRAVEDVSRIIAKMNVAIKDEWLDVFRCARVVLEASAEPLARGDDPPHTPALSRLRTYRQELLERYGAGDEDVLAPPAPGDAVVASEDGAHDESPREPAGGNETDIQSLMYTGEAALRRALDLRARLERAVEHDPDALALVDEVFDLIRLGLQ